MKKIMVLLLASTLMAVATYAQTQKTNRTRTRAHDRSDVTTDQNKTDAADKTTHEHDMDRNNTKIDATTPAPNSNTTNNVISPTRDTARKVNTNHPK